MLGTYVGGGGGGSLRSATSATNIGYGSNNAVNNGGNSGYVSGALVYATGGATNGNPGTGTGGGAGLSTNGSTGYGADGGSGTVTFRYITAFKPTFTQPTIAYLNAGMTETFTTNVAQDSATAVLTRTFRWESTTAGAGGTYSLIKQGTGAANAAFSWVPTDTSTSGSQFLYRVIVTDSDSSGLFIQDTSTAVYAVINRALVLTSKTTLTKTVNVSKTETFTVSLGTPTYSYTLTPTSPNFWLDTSTVGSPRIKFADTVTVGTYYETFTVTDSVSASIVVPLTIVVSPPPSFSASAQQVDSGTVLYLDAGNSSSYPGSGSAWTDLSGRAIATSLTQTFSSTQIAADGSTRSGATMVSNCAAPTYSAEALGVLNFNGTSQCAYASGMGVQSSYTVELWVKRNGAQTSWASTILTNPYRFASDQLNISIFWIGTDTLGAGVYQYPGGWKTLTGFFIEDATWVHISVSMNNGVLRMMKNANTTTSQSLDTTYTTWNKSIMDNGLLIGQRWGDAATTAGWFKGSLASTRIYGRVLSDSEIAQNYNATKGRFLLTQNKQAQVGKYGTRYSDTFTVTSGSETLTSAWSNTSLTQIMWDTSTARTLVLTAQESLTPGTYYDTITVTDIYGASTRLPLTYTIAKADTITVSMDTATVTVYNTLPLVKYPKPVIKGLVNSDTFTVTTKFSSTLYALSSTVPTNADTYTVIAADPVFTVGNSSYYLSIIYETSTAIINKARQTPLNVSMYGAIIGSPFTITLLGGSGDGVVTESLTGTSTAPNCVISSHVLTSSATQISYCQLLVTKAGTQTYFLESSTVQIYFMGFTINQPTNQFGSGSGIALNGATAITRDAQAAPYISEVVWVPLTCLGQVCDRAHWEIRGSGFGLSDNSQTVVKFWRNQVVTLNQSYYAGTRVVTDTTIIIAPEDVPAGATTGKITVTTANGIAISPTNWIAP